MKKFVLLALFMPLLVGAKCQKLPTMSDMLREDQADLQVSLQLPPTAVTAFAKIKVNRKLRNQILDRLDKCNKLVSAPDWYKASIVVGQSGEDNDLLKSMEYANRAIAVDPSLTGPRKMIANSLDRWLLNHKRPQIFGTQWVIAPDGTRKLLPIARCAVSNKTRKEFEIEDWVISSQPDVCPS